MLFFTISETSNQNTYFVDNFFYSKCSKCEGGKAVLDPAIPLDSCYQVSVTYKLNPSESHKMSMVVPSFGGG